MSLMQPFRNALHKRRVFHTARELIGRLGLDGAWAEAGKRHLELMHMGDPAASRLWRDVVDTIVREIKTPRSNRSAGK
jgi:hypothetical protein